MLITNAQLELSEYASLYDKIIGKDHLLRRMTNPAASSEVSSICKEIF
jgi:hypothetical protein